MKEPKKDKLKAIEERVKAMIEKREGEISQLEEKARYFRDEAEKARDDLEKAIESGDGEAYDKAKAALDFAQGRLEHPARRLSLLRFKAIPQEEYKAMCAEVESYILEQDEKAKARLAALSEEMRDISDELKEKTFKANDILEALQSELYKNKDRATAKSGAFISNQDKKKVATLQTTQWGLVGVNSYAYKVFRDLETKQAQPAGKVWG